MITHNHKKLFTKLDKGHLDKPQIIEMPIVRVQLYDHEDQKLEIGGDKAIVHYSEWKEEKHRKDKIDKRMRQLRTQIKREAHRSIGDDLPVTHHDSSGRLQK